MSLQHNQYLMSQEFRRGYSFFGALTFCGLTAFSAFMWCITFLQDKDKLACGGAALVFSIISVIYLLKWFTQRNIIMMKCCYSQDCIANCYGNKEISVEFKNGIYCSRVPLKFSFGRGGSMIIEFLLISEKPFASIPLDTDAPIRAIEALLHNQVVICPNHGDMPGIPDCDSIGEFPSVLYIPYRE